MIHGLFKTIKNWETKHQVFVCNGMGRIDKTDAAESHCASTAQVAGGGAIIRG